MPTDQPLTPQEHADAGDGVELNAREASGGAPRGVTKILVISTALAVVAVGVVWLLMARPTGPPMHAQTGSIGPTPASNGVSGQIGDAKTMSAEGLEKCDAFRTVFNHTRALQAAGGGSVSPSDESRSEAALTTAKALPPATLTPVQCGVPLG